MDFKEFLFCAKKQAFYEEGRRFENGSRWLDEDYFSVRNGNDFVYTRIFNEDLFSMETLTKKGSIVWFMRAYPQFDNGELSTINEELSKKELYAFLRRVLNFMPEDLPIRGPEKFGGGSWIYLNEINGNIRYFKGTEIIKFRDIEVYRMPYYGGFVEDDRNDTAKNTLERL